MAIQTTDTQSRNGQVPQNQSTNGQPTQNSALIDQMQAKVEQSVKPEDMPAFKRVVAAGMKVMFSEQTHQLMLKELQGQGDMATKLAQGITGLMLILYKESKGMPPQVLMPAGAWLLLEAARFIERAGLGQIDPQTIRDALDGYTALMLKKAGASQQQLAQHFGGDVGQAGMPAQQAQPAQQPQGLLNGGGNGPGPA